MVGAPRDGNAAAQAGAGSRLSCRYQVVAGLALLIAACGGVPPPAPGPSALATLVPTPTYTATEAAFAANLNPWTGLPAADPDIGRRQPEAFALAAAPGQLLPYGAQSAELMVEALYPALSGFTLVTQERPGRRPDVGPLATVGERDAVVAQALGTRLTAADATPELARALGLAGVPLTLVAGDTAPAASGPGGRQAAHGPRWGFAEPPDPAARPVRDATARAPGVAAITWRYDPLLGIWHRLVAGQPAVDPGTGEALAVANVVLLELTGAPSAAAWWTGGGGAMLLRDGTALDGRWVRSAAGTPLGLLDGSGLAMALRPGNTWLMLIPQDGDITLEP